MRRAFVLGFLDNRHRAVAGYFKENDYLNCHTEAGKRAESEAAVSDRGWSSLTQLKQ